MNSYNFHKRDFSNTIKQTRPRHHRHHRHGRYQLDKKSEGEGTPGIASGFMISWLQGRYSKTVTTAIASNIATDGTQQTVERHLLHGYSNRVL